MDQQNGDADAQSRGSSYEGYATPGSDTIDQSTSRAIPSPSVPSEQRLAPPDPAIESIGETPGDANPALVETIGYTRGDVSTADLLRAREASEEQGVRARGEEVYQDQWPGTGPDKPSGTDSGRPNWPDDRREPGVEYLESPRATEPYLSSTPVGADEVGQTFKGRVDAVVDRASTQAAAQESRSGLSPVGYESEEDKYEAREFDRPGPPSDLDMIAPGMTNLPPEDNDDK